jgi:hypothetical protein
VKENERFSSKKIIIMYLLLRLYSFTSAEESDWGEKREAGASVSWRREENHR